MEAKVGVEGNLLGLLEESRPEEYGVGSDEAGRRE
jgi:hypothetical protein